MWTRHNSILIQVYSFIDFGPYKNIISNLLTYTGNLQQEFHKYATMKDYTPYNKDRPSTPEEKSRIISFYAISIMYSAEIELIVNIINTSRIQFLSLLGIVSNTNCDEHMDSWHLDRSKRSVLGTVFHWLFGGSGGTDQNIEELKCNMDILMANQNIQQKQIKEIFKLNNLIKVETTWNRKILRQLDVQLISLNHSVYSL